MIPYGRQDISDQDISAVLEVLKSDFLTQGPQVPLFEQTVAGYCGSRFAFAANSATSALHIACLALEVGPGDLVWTTPITFVASANCALYCGADVDFVDIDPATYNLCPKALESKLEQAHQAGRLPKVLIPVHLCGLPCEMPAIKKLADRYGVRIIEDASHAIGGRYSDSAIGSCEYSDITVLSFHPVKIVTTAEGGMALTNQESLADRMELYRSHGVTRRPELMRGDTDGPWSYQQTTLGYNYRMTDLQAALGSSQMTRLDQFVAERHQRADYYDEILSELPITLPTRDKNSYSGLHLYVIQVDAGKRLALFNYLRSKDIGVNVHYIPVHTQPYYQDLGFKKGDFPIAERYYSKAISIPMYPGLKPEEQIYIRDCIAEGLADA